MQNYFTALKHHCCPTYLSFSPLWPLRVFFEIYLNLPHSLWRVSESLSETERWMWWIWLPTATVEPWTDSLWQKQDEWPVHVACCQMSKSDLSLFPGKKKEWEVRALHLSCTEGCSHYKFWYVQKMQIFYSAHNCSAYIKETSYSMLRVNECTTQLKVQPMQQ